MRTIALAMPMILIATTQELRLAVDDPLHDEVVDQAIEQITTCFLKPEERALHEVVSPSGERLDFLFGELLREILLEDFEFRFFLSGEVLPLSLAVAVNGLLPLFGITDNHANCFLVIETVVATL